MKDSHIALELLYRTENNDSNNLSKITGIPLRTTQRALKKLRNRQSLERKKESGRPQKFGSNDKIR